MNYNNNCPLAVTPGEPAGVGPDIVLDYARKNKNTKMLAYADPELLRDRAKDLGYSIKIEVISDVTDVQEVKKNTLFVFPIHLKGTVQPGIPDSKNSSYVLDTLDTALEHAIKGKVSALVTGPINKMLINMSGTNFSGHTEYIASKLKIKNPVMMLAQGRLKVVIVTTHVPLTSVPKMITKERLERIIRVTELDLREKFKIKEPQIGVCGLNPHAGENGHVGTEDILTIKPVISKLQALGLKIDGPIPADTIFAFENYKNFDVIIAMYHDQGLAPFKALAFGEAVNITLGLPIIRTSVDHGTAFDKAATGLALSTSLEAAINVAEQIKKNKHAP